MNENGKVRLALTGGTGFIARGVLENCAGTGLSCRALSRSTRPSWAGQAIEWATVCSYDDTAALRQALGPAKYVLHLADDPARDNMRSAEETVRACDALIEAIRSNRVDGVIVASSVYAAGNRGNGESSYALAKRAIEQRFLAATDIRTVVLRLPPVYGPGGGGGFAMLSKLVRKGLPLPLGAATAPRSYLSRRNLASLIVAMANAGDDAWKSAAGRVFEPSDGVVVGTRDLVHAMAAHIGVAPKLLPVPLGLLRIAAAATGKMELVSGAIDRLDVAPVGELEAAFGWRPLERMPESLAFLRETVSRS